MWQRFGAPLGLKKIQRRRLERVASIPLVKINTHAAWKKESSMAAIGVVIRNLEGIFLMCCADRVTCSSALIAEGRAALRGLKTAIQNDFKVVVIESDSKGLVDGVGESSRRDSSLLNGDGSPVREMELPTVWLGWVVELWRWKAGSIGHQSLVHVLVADRLSCPPSI
ncbi:hypothetical protein L3X38_023892 [Prunus dulcis]|uniref:RNase H type-1 domain-containing protein n=1 Tax=Prunus dulcis TaxID=3755 RepID=A0AAD4Z5N2_PRUDU|nr:hypothetical protein L3X38_023892 [Prunus dulcis]